MREELAAHLKRASADPADGDGPQTAHEHIHRRAIAAARQTILDLRSRDEIGDDAFHRLEEEFDWLEMGTLAGRRARDRPRRAASTRGPDFRPNARQTFRRIRRHLSKILLDSQYICSCIWSA